MRKSVSPADLADHIPVIIPAVVIAVSVMMPSARVIGNFVEINPTIKTLALSFLPLSGFSLVREGFDLHIPKGYIHFALAFSLGVEILNLKVRGRAAKPVRLPKALKG